MNKLHNVDHILQFIHETTYHDCPPEVQYRAQLCLLDVLGSLCGGRQTLLSPIIHKHALDTFGGDQATLLLNGACCSAPGAAMANGMTIDAMDIHDSYRQSLGHAGVHVFPTVMAVSEQIEATTERSISGEAFLTAMVVGYDIACRAAVILHATACDYHTSGAWGAVSSAAIYSRMHGLSAEQTRHALGIAEYHGPRSQMMRCIDHPTMVKDASGWGAMAGISSGMLAASGFTGAPAITVEAPEIAVDWQDLASRWMIMEQGFKVHAVCWWAQPAIEAVLGLVRDHNIAVGQIQQIEIETFVKATRLAHPRPATTEQAQYSLPYPVAAALIANSGEDSSQQVWPGVGPKQLLEDYLHDERVLSLADKIILIEAPDITERFPGRFLARAKITLTDGSTYACGDTTFRGEDDFPLTDAELRTKYRWLASEVLPAERVTAIEETVFELPMLATIQPLLDLLAPPADNL